MSDFNVVSPGQVNQAGATDALFLKLFAGEVLTTFDQENVMMARTMVRTITHGKSAAFPVTGRVKAAYHTPGEELTGQNTSVQEKVINIDGKLVADVFFSDIDEAMNHWDVRAPISAECGRELARQADSRLLRIVLLAAAKPATLSNHPGVTYFGGSRITSATSATVAADLRKAIIDAAKTLDEKNVPRSERYCVVKPAQYYLLLEDTGGSMNRDYGGQGNLSTGAIAPIAGIQIAMSNSYPTGVVSAVSGEKNTYNGTFTNSVAAVFQKGVAGTVKLRDLATQSEYSVRHQGTIVVASYAMGHSDLRPECAVEIITA